MRKKKRYSRAQWTGPQKNASAISPLLRGFKLLFRMMNIWNAIKKIQKKRVSLHNIASFRSQMLLILGVYRGKGKTETEKGQADRLSDICM